MFFSASKNGFIVN